MKEFKKFEEPVLMINRFTVEDVITTSYVPGENELPPVPVI